MIPTLFGVNYIPPFSNAEKKYPGDYPIHGETDLSDAIECFAVQTCDDDSVEWELEMIYPINGIGFGQLAINKIIAVKANSYQSHLQGFRIYSIQRKIDQTVSVKAQHISYDMANVPVKPFLIKKTTSSSSNSAAVEAIKKLRDNSDMETTVIKCRFKLGTDFDDDRKATDNAQFKLAEPKSMRAVLLDGDDSIRGTYGGDLVIDNYTIDLKRVGGEDRGITIVYGVDLIDLEQEKNIGEMVTGILPFYRENSKDSGSDAMDTYTYGSITPALDPEKYPVPKIVPVDLTSYFEKKPAVKDLNEKAAQWVKKSNIGKPEINLKVSYAYLKQDIRMFDAVKVVFPKLNVDNKAKVVKYKYNVLLERCEEVELGKARGSKYFSLLDASRLRKGLLPPDRIGKGSVRGGGGGHIAPKTVTGDDMQDNTIYHGILAGGSVDTVNIVGGSVTGAKIATGDNGVNTKNIVAGAVTGAKIATGDDGVKNANIADGAVTNTKIHPLTIDDDRFTTTVRNKLRAAGYQLYD